MSKKILLTMPQPGETITEGTVVRWVKKVGDTIKEGEVLVELETEKAVFEYESPYEGKLLEIMAPDGRTVPVGNSMASFEVEDAKASTYLMLGIGKQVAPGGASSTPAAKKEVGNARESTKNLSKRGVSPKLSPLIRSLMQEYGIASEELSPIQATGPGGRITKEDILGYLEAKKEPQEVPKQTSFTDSDLVPCSPIRARIAEHMVQSKKMIPHAHTGLTIDMTAVIQYREKLKKDFEKKEGIPLGILPLIFTSLKKAIHQYPLVNASFKEEGGKKMIAVHKKINFGIAVDTERGLYIPVIHEADKKSFLEFAKSFEELLGKAQKNKFTVNDLTGVTFTFNNYGFFGTMIGVQIILPPQSTTLGMGRIEKRPSVVDDKIEIRSLADFMLAFDHRVIDGRDAGLFLLALKKTIENFSEMDLL